MLTSGFYNSLNGDRKYSAEQISAMFDGMITDGVYQSEGGKFFTTSTSGRNIAVDSGRGWFNNIWVYNDAKLPLTVSPSEALLNRIDTVALVIDKNEANRKAEIKMVNGIPAVNPNPPTLTGDRFQWLYPLAYIDVKAGSTVVEEQDITICVGTDCPWAGLVNQSAWIDTQTRLFNDWLNAQKITFNSFIGNKTTEFARFTNDKNEEFVRFTDSKEQEYRAFITEKNNDVNGFVSEKDTEISTWFNEEKDTIHNWYVNEKESVNEMTDGIKKALRTNMLKPTLETTSRNGVTCKYNGDGTYTLNGTATGNYAQFVLLTMDLKVGTYKLVGNPNILPCEMYFSHFASDRGNGVTFTVEENLTAVPLNLYVPKDFVCNNLVFKPMLSTDLSITYADYIPYNADKSLIENLITNADFPSRAEFSVLVGRVDNIATVENETLVIDARPYSEYVLDGGDSTNV